MDIEEAGLDDVADPDDELNDYPDYGDSLGEGDYGGDLEIQAPGDPAKRPTFPAWPCGPS